MLTLHFYSEIVVDKKSVHIFLFDYLMERSPRNSWCRSFSNQTAPKLCWVKPLHCGPALSSSFVMLHNHFWWQNVFVLWSLSPGVTWSHWPHVSIAGNVVCSVRGMLVGAPPYTSVHSIYIWLFHHTRAPPHHPKIWKPITIDNQKDLFFDLV